MGDVFWMREISKKKRDGRGGSDDNYKSKYGAFGNETMAHIKYEGSSRRSYIFVFKQKNVRGTQPCVVVGKTMLMGWSGEECSESGKLAFSCPGYWVDSLIWICAHFVWM